MSNATVIAIVGGLIKYAGLEARRLAASRGGLARHGRRVLDELPVDVPDRNTVAEIDAGERRRRWRIILGQIRECTPRRYQRLVVRRLCRGTAIVTLARRYGLDPDYARTVVLRARAYVFPK